MATSALFALLLQLVLSFGHVHPHHSGQGSATIEAAGVGGHGTSAPLDGDGDEDEGFCAQCAFSALLDGAQIALAPSVPTPAQAGVVEIPNGSHESLSDLQHFAFRSRGPPGA